MNMNFNIVAYLIYLPVTIILTVWVARTLFKHGRIFLVDIFHGNESLADSINRLLLVGFYLINSGYAVYTLTIMDNLNGYQEVIELLSRKVGAIILILGLMHFFNLFTLFRMRKKAKTIEA